MYVPRLLIDAVGKGLLRCQLVEYCGYYQLFYEYDGESLEELWFSCEQVECEDRVHCDDR